MAIVSLVFMALFVVSLTVTMANPKLLNGNIGFVALFTGFVGIGIFISIWLSDRAAKRRDDASEKTDDGTPESGKGEKDKSADRGENSDRKD